MGGRATPIFNRLPDHDQRFSEFLEGLVILCCRGRHAGHGPLRGVIRQRRASQQNYFCVSSVCSRLVLAEVSAVEGFTGSEFLIYDDCVARQYSMSSQARLMTPKISS